jgi:hypothetical protein
MKIRGLAIAVLVLVVLSGFLYWSERHKPSDETSKASAETPAAILKLDQGAVSKLEIRKKDTAPILLTTSSSGEWQIVAPQQLRADQSAVSGVLTTLSNLSSERIVDDKASDLKTYGLGEPTLEVNVIENDNKSQKLLIGYDTAASGSVYAMLAGDPRLFTMASYNKNSLDKSLNDLRDKRLLTVSADKVSRVELTNKNEKVEFGRNKDEWQILKPKPLRADRNAVGDLVRKLTDAKMDLTGTAASEATATFAHGSQVASARVTDESGAQELQVRKNRDNYYARSSTVAGIYKVDADLGKELEKSLDDFRNKKLFDFGFAEPNTIELHSDSKSYSFTRSRKSNIDEWSSNGKILDSGSVESLISDLRDLAATKFPQSGFGSPTIQITIASDDGKRIEKAAIAKSGDKYVARRESDASLYQLDKSSVEGLLKAADDVKPTATPNSAKGQ